MSALRMRESNPRTWRPFNPASIIGMSWIRGWLQERAEPTHASLRHQQPPSSRELLPRNHALFPRRGIRCRWPPGIPNVWLKISWDARMAPAMRSVTAVTEALSGAEKEESIYLTCRTLWSPSLLTVFLPSPGRHSWPSIALIAIYGE